VSQDLARLWVYLAADPLLWLTLTLLAYLAGLHLHRRFGGNPLLNPVLIAVLLLVGIVLGAGVQYRDYFAGAQFVHFLLGPATVALAVPLFRQLAGVRRALPALLAALVAGSLTAAGSAVLIGWALGADRQTLLSLAPKSATTPIAMGVAEQIGGLPSLTAVLVILTGIVGAVIATQTLNLIGVRDWRARGFAVGTVSHGIGTARAFQVNQIAGAYAGLAMGFNGILTAVALPLLLRLID